MKPLKLDQLLRTFLRERASAGLADVELSEVVLHQTAGVQLVDPKTALDHALEVVSCLLDGSGAASFQSKKLNVPSEWAVLVRQHEVGVALPFCLGNFPQMIQDATSLLGETNLARLRPRNGQTDTAHGVLENVSSAAAQERLPDVLFAAAVMRIARRFEDAETMLLRVREASSGRFDAVLLNEEAALAWHRGESEQAARRWAMHPKQDSAAIQFNRGLAALFSNDREPAQRFFRAASQALSERSPWHHLAKLYGTVAEAAIS